MSCFVAHLSCPVCAWGTVASAPSYVDAERQVSSQLLEHLAQQHAALNEAPQEPRPQPVNAPALR